MAVLLFLVLWLTLVYAPIAHWVWAPNGWLFEEGALDFAGDDNTTFTIYEFKE